ncbi:MAG TPA: hypothetical protein VGR09_02095 [Gemmatimonadales bacterium]|nr:hypothetical protein [Gemmatimonadales bacterium]
MSSRTVRYLALATVSPLVALLLLAARPSGELARVAGTYTMTYSQRHPIPVPDADGHVVIATQATGANRSTGPSPFEDRAQVTIIESADITQGSGPHQGYAVMSLDGKVIVNRWSGKLTTVLDKDQHPSTSFKGNWTSVKGPAGHGTYEGRITGPDTYTVEWAGQVDLK